MKNKIKISVIASLLIISTILVFSHCAKKNNEKITSKESKNPAKLFLNSVPIISGSYDFDVAVWVDQYYDFYKNDNSNTANTNTSFDTTILNSISINSTNYNTSNGMFSIMDMPMATMNSIFGNNTTFATPGGSGFTSFTENMYVPTLFIPNYSGFSVGNNGVSVSKSAGFSISFNVDNSNTHDNLIFIKDLNNPTNQLEIYIPYNVPTKAFNSADLNQFPVGAKLDFAIARGNVKYKTHNNSEIQFRCGVIQHCTTFELKP